MKRKPKKTPVIKPSNLWWCDSCNLGSMEHGQMIEHLKAVHKINTKKTKARRQMVLHLDSEDSYTSTYEWTIGTLKCTQTVTNPREADDMMRWQ